MNYKETLEYLYTTLPMYQRIGAAAYKEDLTNTLALCQALDNPQRKFKSIHVAGTNGKGSTSHMLAAILQSAGYKTGLYTSPHLKDFTERIKIDGKPVTEDYVIGFVKKITPTLEAIQPSFFETTVAMAFEYFVQEKVDIAVIEVGLGGRLDSTNVIIPLVSIITNISYDHQNILGDTLVKIAMEKAGIIKPSVPVVISQRQTEVEDVFLEKAKSNEAPLSFADDTFVLKQNAEAGAYDVIKNGILLFDDIHCELKGAYQRKNISGVLMVIELLRKAGWDISDKSLLQGISKVVTLTGLKGRWQILKENPLTICDIGHNEDGIREVLRNIDMIPHRNLHIVFGMVNDKDITKVLTLLPKHAHYYFCQAKIPRAMHANELAAKANDVGIGGEVIPDVNDAIRKATEAAGQEDLIFIGGSAFVVAEIDSL